MSGSQAKTARKNLRRLLGPRGAAVALTTAYDFDAFMRRGFWGRLRWLLFGA